MIDAKLHKHDQIIIDNIFFPIRPTPHSSPTTTLICILPPSIQLPIAILDRINTPIRKLGTLEIETLPIAQHLLERRRMDLIRHRLPIDGVPHAGVLDFKRPVRGVVDVVAARVCNKGFGSSVARAVWVEVAARHGVRFVVDEAVGGAVDHGVDAQGEDVLVVGGEDAWVDDSTPGNFKAFVDGLGGEDAGCADFVGEFAGLVEHEGHDVFVVCDAVYVLAPILDVLV